MAGLGYKEKIEDVGLRKYLDDTTDKHNGHDYDYIVPLFEAKVNDTNIGKLYKVDWRTVKSWREIYNKEITNES
jgi:hypothetical protein